MPKVFLSGNEAVAQGAFEAGVGLGIGYPGTPSTEIIEVLEKKEGPDCAWAINEKVALEQAYGACVAGLRSLVTMKHVGVMMHPRKRFRCQLTSSLKNRIPTITAPAAPRPVQTA